jgi:signal transduction histidine kinase
LTTVPNEEAICLYRIAQEALRNVARHAAARVAEVSLERVNGGLQLAVWDNGKGFDPVRMRDRPSLGLASMRERLRALGGKLSIDSAPGKGTVVLAWVPLNGGTS